MQINSEKELRSLAKEFIEKNERAVLDDIGALVKHRSVEAASAGEGCPFGTDVRKALDEAMDIAEGFGLDTGENDGYMGWGELEGEEDGHIAMIAHVDVVPEGGGWDGDPYIMREKDGWILGRGVSDDKGPAVLSLYTAKFFKENNIKLRYGLRVLMGCNEETGMSDVDYYLERNEQPLFCFSPDASFPVCCGEKGIYSGNFTSSRVEGGKIAEFSGGIAGNVVPEHASCLIDAEMSRLLSLPEGISAEEENGKIRIGAKGTGGHAAMPEGTKNAIYMLAVFLLERKLCGESEVPFLSMLKTLLSTTDGSSSKINSDDGIFTPLTCIGGTVSLENGIFKQSVNIRYPTSTNANTITEKLKAFAAEYGCSFEKLSDSPPYYIGKDSPQVKSLLSSYNDVFETVGEPYTMGGGTYSRHFENACAFGPEQEGEALPDFAGPVHGANEGIKISTLMKALETYILAVWRLQGVDF